MKAVTARPLVVGNWKMNLGEAAAARLAGVLRETLPFDGVDAAVAPAFPCLRAVLDAVAGSALGVGAQNMHWEDKGPFTGEVAPTQLFEMGVRFVILGHSERRAMFGETDAIVARKVASARSHGLVPIVCVGESEEQRDRGETREVVVAQIHAAFATDAPDSPGERVVAYEPIWAIGTGRTPEPAEVGEAHGAIRAALEDRFGTASRAIRILYGGSVTPENAPIILREKGVDGALVGGASLNADSFRDIAAAAAAC